LLEFEVNRTLWPESHLRPNFDLLTPYKLEAPLLSQNGDQQNAFHHREMLTNADTRPGAKRIERKLGSVCGAFFKPPIRIETFGIGPNLQ
jgi:hypothetical protein